MQVPLDLVSLVLYAVQQLGVMLGVGAQTILLITYVISVRDGVVDAKESQIARAVNKALLFGIGLIIFSGAGVVVLHYMLGQWMILLAPAFLFKWLLVVFLFTATFSWRKHPFPSFVWEGLIGASWYALFVVHILAPVAAWFDLLVLYTLWVAGFLLLWSALVFMTHKKGGGQATMNIVSKRSSDLAEDGARPFSQQPPPPLVKKVEEKKPEPKPEPKPVPKPLPPPPPPPPKPVPPPLPSVALAKEGPPVIKPEPERKPGTMPAVTSVLPPNPPMVAPPANLPTIKPVEEKPADAKPKVNLNEHPGLPAIRIMPKTPEDAKKHI